MTISQRNTTERAARAMLRAEELSAKGQLPEAIRSLQSALRYGANPSLCYLRLARLYQSQKQLTMAIEAASKAVDLDPANIIAWEALLTLSIENKDFQKAVNIGRKLIKIAPNHIPARDMLGYAYMGLGNLDAAMRVTNDQIRLDPSNPSHHYTRAMLCMHSGETEMAIIELERVLNMTDDTDMINAATDQLEMLDTHQIEKIVVLAVEDDIFRMKLAMDIREAVESKGFVLSENGLEQLTVLCSQGLTEMKVDGPSRSIRYH